MKKIYRTPFANTTEYTYIAIKRKKNNIVDTPIVSSLTLSGGTSQFLLASDYMKLAPEDTAPITCSSSALGAIYFDISEDDMCVCKTTGWRVMTDGSACT